MQGSYRLDFGFRGRLEVVLDFRGRLVEVGIRTFGQLQPFDSPEPEDFLALQPLDSPGPEDFLAL